MDHLLYNYFIKDKKKDIDFVILCILHELRISTSKQLFRFLNLSIDIKISTVYKHLLRLENNECVCSFSDKRDPSIKIYYLTKLGYLSIGGFYTLAKVPEYNWYHCLMINDSLIQTLEVIKDHPNLRYIQTERRQVYETKDMEKSRNGNVYFVADYLARFNSPSMRNIDWYFEIELTIKTKKRYQKNIFVKYINHLQEYNSARVIYVSPSSTIQIDLEKFKNYFYRNILDRDQAEDIFSRFHIFSMEEFPERLQEIVATDPFINWQKGNE